MSDSSLLGRTNTFGSERQPGGWSTWHQKEWGAGSVGVRVCGAGSLVTEPAFILRAWGSSQRVPMQEGASHLCLEGSLALSGKPVYSSNQEGKHRSCRPTGFAVLRTRGHLVMRRGFSVCLQTGRCTRAVIYSVVHLTRVGGLCCYVLVVWSIYWVPGAACVLVQPWKNSCLSSFTVLSCGHITY